MNNMETFWSTSHAAGAQSSYLESLYDPIQKTLNKRDVNFAPAQVETFEPKVRTY